MLMTFIIPIIFPFLIYQLNIELDDNRYHISVIHEGGYYLYQKYFIFAFIKIFSSQLSKFQKLTFK